MEPIDKEEGRMSHILNLIRPYVMIAPAMIGIGLFVFYPLVYLFYISLFDFNLMNRLKSEFIGFQNYAEILAREDFYDVLKNTLVYTIGVVLFTIIISLFVAFWLKKQSKLNFIVQAGIFTPHVISIVSISLVWMWLMEPNHGLLNFVLNSLNLPTSQWLQSSSSSMLSIIIVSVWGNIGYYALIIVAAIQGIPGSLYEAAQLDNASRWSILRRITVPMISPQLFFILVTMTIGSFKVFDTVRIMTAGGPNNSTNTIVYYIYSFRTTNIGYASAIGILLVIIIGILTIIYFKILAKKVHYQ
ncbi:ABC transporter permease [Lysinibacillus sp. PLM2]|nr:ABC transporter permease [Lysinibacillus sp. PLM2]